MNTATTTAEAAAADPNPFGKGALQLRAVTAKYGIGRSVLYEMMADGRLPYSRVGNRRVIPAAAIEALLARGMVGG